MSADNYKRNALKVEEYDAVEEGSVTKKVEFGSRRESSAPVASYTDPSDDLLHDLEQNPARLQRKLSQRDNNVEGGESLFSFADATHFSSLVSSNELLDKYFPTSLISSIWSTIRKRIKGYCVSAGFLALILVSSGQFNDRQLRGLRATEWFYLLNLLFVLNACIAILEDIVFHLFSVLWWGPYDVVYYLEALYGPLGDLLTVSALVNFFDNTKLPSFSLDIQDCVTMVLVIIISLIWKRFIFRRHYMSMLEHRLRDRLEGIEKTTTIISALSSIKKLIDYNTDAESVSESDHKETGGIGEVYRRVARVNPSTVASESSGNSGNSRTKVSDFFAEVVQKSKDALDTDADEDEDEEALRHRSFWKRVHSLQSGSLNIMTSSGMVRIRRKKHAVSFGKRLYAHMKQGAARKGGREGLITTRILKAALVAYCTDEADFNEDETKQFVSKAIQILGCNEDNDTDECAEDNCVSALVSLYKEIRFAAKSLDDLQLLHKSVLSIANAVFWVLMFLIAQIVLGVNTLTTLAPLLTILFGVSFAIGPMLSNVCLALSFVIFVIPYDIGNKIVIGDARKTGLYGTVSSITLMYTTIITPLHEMVNVPNYTLFMSRIINLNESKTATFDLNISFCNDGPYAVSEDQIDEFIRRLRKYFVEDNKKYWQSFDYYCVGLDVPNNTTNYSFWCEHKGAWNETGKVLVGRTYAWRQLRIIQREMGIKFMQLTTSVNFSPHAPYGPTGGGDGMNVDNRDAVSQQIPQSRMF